MKAIDLTYKTFLAVAAMFLLAACQRDEPFGPEDGERMHLSAYKERMMTRAAGTDEYFAEGTQYRIWMSGQSIPSEGVVGTESRRSGDSAPYIDLGTYNDGLSGRIDFYGLTLGTETAPTESPVNSAYAIGLSAADGSGDYPDYRRGALPAGSATASGGILRMSFRHIMSQVRLVVMREEGVTSDLQLVSVAFVGAKNGEETTGVAVSGTYNVQDNLFTFSELKKERTVIPAGGSLPVPVVGTSAGQEKEAKDVRTVLVFPEKGDGLNGGNAADDKQKHYLRVTFKDPGNFYELHDQASPDAEVFIDIPIIDNRVTSGSAPLHFEQNTAYTLCISFLSNTARIVTLVPQVYEWMDGERSDEGNGQEQELGQPLTFNNVVWADRNLGATSAHTTAGIDQWRKSVGYFYQYGRNIPYFPNDLIIENGDTLGIDLNTSMDVALKTGGVRNGSRPLYPVINFSSWETSAAELHQLPGGLAKYIVPTPYVDPWLIWKQGVHGNYGASQPDNNQTRWCFAYSEKDAWYQLNKLSGYNNDWAANTDYTPCPKGWRLPTVEDFRGIIPGSGYSGNITFRKFTRITDAKGWGVEWAYSAKEPPFSTVFGTEIGNYPTIDASKYPTPIYEGRYPCILRKEKDDPSEGDNSQYVLSMMNEEGFRDWMRVRDISGELKPDDPDYIFNWGVIYGIKKQGTASAYRMKWEIKLFSETVPTTVDGGTDSDGSALPPIYAYGTPFRGVLVISRYAASKDDQFTVGADGTCRESVRSFDWNHPVELMYLPIGGIADSWSQGKLANIGTETWYAIGELPRQAGKTWQNQTIKNVLWIKFAGNSTDNQTILLHEESKMAASVQIRCVRDMDGQ